MNLVVTCGPASEPVDTTRRLTNISTGRLGVSLAQAFREAGHEVLCLRGAGATFHHHPSGVRFQEFERNADLGEKLAVLSRTENVDAVFHAAALCDFGVAEVRDAAGAPAPAGKLPSRAEGYQLLLRPLPKLLPALRALFPGAFLAGWKYETEGGAERVVSLGRRQIAEAATDLCVVNGPGYGPGYGLVASDGAVVTATDAGALADALLVRLAARKPAA